ncbi:MAG: hypothetical protein WBA13_00575 [Microcoleaceae cyanobacterium]
MKLNIKDFYKREHQSRVIQPMMALVLAACPILIFGYTPPGDQRPPYDRGGRSGSLYPFEPADILPNSF